jgi:hypothetical protein
VAAAVPGAEPVREAELGIAGFSALVTRDQPEKSFTRRASASPALASASMIRAERSKKERASIVICLVCGEGC